MVSARQRASVSLTATSSSPTGPCWSGRRPLERRLLGIGADHPDVGRPPERLEAGRGALADERDHRGRNALHDWSIEPSIDRPRSPAESGPASIWSGLVGRLAGGNSLDLGAGCRDGWPLRG